MAKKISKKSKKDELYYIKVDHDSIIETTREPSDDGWDRGDTDSQHYINGFSVTTDADYDIVLPYMPRHNATYYLLYATYSTGDSFGHDANGRIEFIGFYKRDQLSIAEENVNRIRDKEFYKDYSVKLLTPDGKKTYKQHCPWEGYFESLDTVDIKEVQRRDR